MDTGGIRNVSIDDTQGTYNPSILSGRTGSLVETPQEDSGLRHAH